MKFLVDSGGIDDPDFGILTSPKTRGISKGIRSGLVWGADLGCLSGPDFVKRFDRKKTKDWLCTLLPYMDRCLFVTSPDHVGNAKRTLRDFNKFQFDGFPVAYVAQDGQEDLEFPDDDKWQALFVGGSTEWKTSNAALNVINRALELNKHIHIGRVNYRKRYALFGQIKGSERFTCDGTRIRYQRTKAIEDWKEYMEYTTDFCRDLFASYSNRKSTNS